jgi:hypothetical protein
MKLNDLSILEVRILKHLYCQNPHRHYNDPQERFKYAHGLELTSTDGMRVRLYLTSIKSGSDLYQRLDPGVCIPGGTLNYIHSQLKAPKVVEGSKVAMPQSFRRSFTDAVRNLIHRGLVDGFMSGYEIAEGEDGFRAPVPARWTEADGEADRVVGVSLTEEGFAAARELFMQLAEVGE